MTKAKFLPWEHHATANDRFEVEVWTYEEGNRLVRLFPAAHLGEVVMTLFDYGCRHRVMEFVTAYYDDELREPVEFNDCDPWTVYVRCLNG